MQTLILILLVVPILSLFSERLKRTIQRTLHQSPALIWVAPPLLTGIFSAAALFVHALTAPLAFLVVAYTSLPVLCAWLQGAGFVKKPTGADFLTVLLIWLPMEFAAGAALVSVPARGFLHSVAYAVAILLGLVLFTEFRSFPDVKYSLPRKTSDFRLPFAGFLVAAPVLIALGIAIGFIPAPHWPRQTTGTMSAAVAIIFLGTALPEEILFRSLIQNLLTLRFGAGIRTLLVASFIFGCAHLNNGPQPLPNWRYMVLATIAGIAYGWVFRRATTVLSSAALHMMVDWTKHFFF